MVYAFLPELGLHLLICTLGEFVIFLDITGSERNRYLPIILIYRWFAEIWFSVKISHILVRLGLPLSNPDQLKSLQQEQVATCT